MMGVCWRREGGGGWGTREEGAGKVPGALLAQSRALTRTRHASSPNLTLTQDGAAVCPSRGCGRKAATSCRKKKHPSGCAENRTSTNKKPRCSVLILHKKKRKTKYQMKTFHPSPQIEPGSPSRLVPIWHILHTTRKHV